MTDYVDLLRTETEQKFQLYQEMIPNFNSTLKPVNDSLKNISQLLESISLTQKKLEESCDTSCMSCSPELLRKFLGLEVEQKENNVEGKETLAANPTQVDQNQAPNTKEKAKTVENERRFVPPISELEFKTIPKYQLGRFTLESLNEIVAKMDEFLTKKHAIQTKTNKQLTRIDRELLDTWRELEMKAKSKLSGNLFFVESDVRPLLQERLRPSFSKAIPCLRHIRRIREERCGPLTFYFA